MAPLADVEILLVEDNPADAQLVQLALEETALAGRVRATVARVEDALRQLARLRFDVILLDLSLPDAEGYSAVRGLHRAAPHVPIIVLTGNVAPDAGTRAVQHGAQDYFVKGDFSPVALERAIEFAVERSRLAVRLREVQKLESLGLMAGGIAHDFNNLLTPVLTCIDLALDGLDPERTELLDQARTAARRAGQLARQLLVYAGQGVGELKRVDVSALLGELSGLVRAAVQDTVTLSLELAPDAPAVEADANELSQALLNLLTNAAEALGGKPGTVRVCLRRVEQRTDGELRAYLESRCATTESA